MIVGIHQPNFCPWLPFFEKVRSSDVFVILGHCQFEKGGYQNRFFADGWSTMSVSRGLEPIISKIYIRPREDWDRILKKFPQLSRFSDCVSDSLHETNSAIIRKACRELKIKTKIVDDYPTDLTSNERLVDIVRRCGGDTYLSGLGAKKYLDESAFNKYGIKVVFQEKVNPKPMVEIFS